MTGIQLIAAERERQIRTEGFSPEEDTKYTEPELLSAAICYSRVAMTSLDPYSQSAAAPVEEPPSDWPWSEEWWKPSEDPTRNLVKAGALIAAEIDRLQARK